jgi:hypothetical protein
MEIRIAEDKWTAEILSSPQSEISEFIHLEARIRGVSQADALKGAQVVIDLFAKGRTAYIRARPESGTDTDFDSKEVKHHGYVRFSFRLEAGSWHDADKSYEKEPQIVGFGSLEAYLKWRFHDPENP